METTKIGGKIAEARKKIDISQAELAKRLFISAQAVGKWERGESMPDITTFIRLADILGVDLNYFSNHTTVATNEIEPIEISANQSAELQSGKQKKKLSWDMSRGNWVDVDFSGLKNLNEKFSSSNMQRCLFIGSDLSGLLLKSNNINGCDFSNSNLNNSHIQNSNIVNNSFKDCSLKETEFSGSHIMGSDFTEADFTGTTFKSGGFENNPITNALWNRTSFNAMYVANVVFEGKLEGCYFENCAFSKVTFQNSTLINTFFKNKSLKRIKFIDCKVDKMTYAFLKNGKADLSSITLLTS